MNKFNTAAEINAYLLKGLKILTACNLRADWIRNKAKTMKYGKTTAHQIATINARYYLYTLADKHEERGRKIWGNLTNFQGSVINWRHLTADGVQIFDLVLNASTHYETILPEAKKLAGL